MCVCRASVRFSCLPKNLHSLKGLSPRSSLGEHVGRGDDSDGAEPSGERRVSLLKRNVDALHVAKALTPNVGPVEQAVVMAWK